MNIRQLLLALVLLHYWPALHAAALPYCEESSWQQIQSFDSSNQQLIAEQYDLSSLWESGARYRLRQPLQVHNLETRDVFRLNLQGGGWRLGFYPSTDNTTAALLMADLVKRWQLTKVRKNYYQRETDHGSLAVGVDEQGLYVRCSGG